jgi:hypothetical protein
MHTRSAARSDREGASAAVRDNTRPSPCPFGPWSRSNDPIGGANPDDVDDL